MSTTATGTWVENRDTPGYSLYTLEGKIQYDVTVEGAQRPIPVIAKNVNDVKAVLKAHGLKYVSASRAGEVLGLHDSMKVVDADQAIAAYKASDEEAAQTKAVKDGIADQAQATPDAAPAENSRDDIDNLLDAAAANEPATPAKAPAARKATPDPKPSQAAKGKGKGAGKGRAAKPATSAEKAAARKADTTAGKRTAAKTPATPAKAATPASEKRAKERQQVIDLFNDPKFAEGTTGAARRKAIAEKLPQFRGRVNGILTAAGVKQ